MTYEELVQKLKSNFEGMDAGRIKEHLAIQFNVAGEAEGALYMEIRDGKVMIEPYEYYDRDILVFVETDALLAIADSELTIYEAFKEGKFYAEGNLGKVELLDSLSKKATARKAAEKKELVVEEKPEVVEQAEPIAEAKPEVVEQAEPIVEAKPEVVEQAEPIAEAKTKVVEQAEPVAEEKAEVVEQAVPKQEEKKISGRKLPSRKLKKAAAKKNARKNSSKK